MATFYDLVKNSLWHAFRGLTDGNSCNVQKSKLKVFAASLGNLLGCSNVEINLSEHHSTPHLNFSNFVFYLEKELFSCLPETFDRTCSNLYDVHFICWLVFKHQLPIEMLKDGVLSEDKTLPKLFCIFSTLGTFTSANETCLVSMDSEEVEYVFQFLIDTIQGKSVRMSHDLIASTATDCLTFKEFVELLDKRVSFHDREAISDAVHKVHETIVEDILRKGNLRKVLSPVGPLLKVQVVLKQHSVILRSCHLTSAPIREETFFHKTQFQVQNLPGNHFTVILGEKAVHLLAKNQLSKLHWLSAFTLATKQCQLPEPYQRHCWRLWRMERILTKQKMQEQVSHYKQQKVSLENEINLRKGLEENLKQIEVKLREFEVKENNLLILLDEERRAKRDEEIVRNLQSRILREEWEHREVTAKKVEKLEADIAKLEDEHRCLVKVLEEKESNIEDLTQAVHRLRTNMVALQSAKVIGQEHCGKPQRQTL